MTTHKTAELVGRLLDIAVALAEGFERDEDTPDSWYTPEGHLFVISEQGERNRMGYQPSSNWCVGGPIIERERIDLDQGGEGDYVTASINEDLGNANFSLIASCDGPTVLVAAMRTFVASKFGDTVDLP